MAKMDFLLLNLLAVFVGAWLLQNLFLLNSDVSWLIHASQQMLRGGTYAGAFLETNPPLILYLYLPVVLLKEFTQLNVVIALRIYVFTLSATSLWLGSLYLKKLFSTRQDISALLLTCLSVIYLILPLSDFGQREHLTVLLITPYLFLITARLKNIDVRLTGLIGTLAGLGYCLKPFFLVIFVMNEIYIWRRKRTIQACIRTETAAVILTSWLYLMVIYYLHQDYLTVILPLIAPSYYTLYTQTLSHMLYQPASVFTYCTILFYLMHRKIMDSDLSSVLLISMLGFWLIYISQRTDWYYHELPSLSYALLIMSYLYFALTHQPALTRNELLKTTLFTLGVFAYFIFAASYVYTNIPFPFYLSAFFCLLGIMAAFCISGVRSVLASYCLSIAIVLLASLFYQYLAHTIWYQHQIALTVIMVFLILELILPHQTLKTSINWLVLMLTGIAIFTYPFYRAAFVTVYSEHYFYLYRQLLAKAKPYQHHSSYYFTNTSELTFPLVEYTQQSYASRFWSMIWLPQPTNPLAIHSYTDFYQQHQTALDTYVKFIVEDFNMNKPETIFVDDRVNSTSYYYGAAAPDFLVLFSSNSAFNHVWSHYRMTNVIDLPPLCRFKVYTYQR